MVYPVFLNQDNFLGIYFNLFLNVSLINRDLVGSKYYVAPDVLRRSYNHTADIWSCGIIMYMLLTGYPPFIGDTLQETFDNIIKVIIYLI